MKSSPLRRSSSESESGGVTGGEYDLEFSAAEINMLAIADPVGDAPWADGVGIRVHAGRERSTKPLGCEGVAGIGVGLALGIGAAELSVFVENL